MSTLLAPFLIGLAGSLHCVGMCSPLVMAVSKTGRHAVFRNLQYNLGRILTYGVLGSIVSLAGSALYLAGIQQWVSIGVGVVVLVIGAMSMRVAAPAFVQASIIKVMNFLKSKFSIVLSSTNVFGVVMLGMINGLLPCGMTLVALGYAMTLGQPVDGFMAMLVFGIGTLPAMVGFAWVTRNLVARMQVTYRTIQTALIIISGVILIGRGILLDDSSSGHSHASKDAVVCGAELNGKSSILLP